MNAFLQLFIFLPLVGFFASLLVKRQNEARIAQIAIITFVGHALAFYLFWLYWAAVGFPKLELKSFALFQGQGYEFYLDFFFDRVTAAYVFVGSFLTFMVAVYSRYYMHRESGYKRFFSTILFFYAGYNIVVFSGNLETMFIGWEMLGITSFLLIAFYRDRYLPVKNAVKVFSIYRIGDVGLLLAIWMNHHLFHQSVTFQMLQDNAYVQEHLQSGTFLGIFISLMILVAAAGKSAQLPFSSWLPRAMEGPTPSSAIFYGSLSVHMGVFLLLRTFPFWEDQVSVRLIIAALGITTCLVATIIARSQAAIKAQIAYASIAQIGLIFVEVAAGWHTLALVHFAGNAFLRTYQLLVSPSVVSYLIREQFYNFVPRSQHLGQSWPKKLESTLYMLSLKEFNLDSWMYRCLWNPIKMLGHKLDFLSFWRVLIPSIPVYAAGLYVAYHKGSVPAAVAHLLALVFAFVALLFVLRSFAERRRTRMAWLMTLMTHFWIALAVSLNAEFSFNETYLYLSGVAIAGLIGFWCLKRIHKLEGHIALDQFHGQVQDHPQTAFVFLLCCLGVTGFPISPTFIGEDLMFAHIGGDQVLLAFLVSLSFIVVGLSIIRIYARVFLGPRVQAASRCS